MLDVHGPHETIHTWKDFFVHIAAIVVGLLIAVGLEQTVEYLHHRHQVAEARAALDVELRVNLNRFEAETEVFRRHVPIVQTNLAVFQYLRQHPGAPATQWPGKIEWGGPIFPCSNDTWKSVQQSGVLEHMPPAEVRHYAAINRRCEELAGFVYARRAAIQRAYMYAIAQPDPSLFSPAQIDEEISLTTSVLLA
jgi:hypothetical protein